SIQYLVPFVKENLINGQAGAIISTVVALMILSPFIWGLSIKRSNKLEYARLWVDKRYSRFPLILLEVFRALLALFFIGFLIHNIFSSTIAFVVAVLITALVFFVFSGSLRKFYSRIEDRFIDNLNARDELDETEAVPVLLPWDAHLTY